jgi:hypothetical protein
MLKIRPYVIQKGPETIKARFNITIKTQKLFN